MVIGAVEADAGQPGQADAVAKLPLCVEKRVVAASA